MTTSQASSPGRLRSDLTLFLLTAFGVSWAAWFAAIGLGGPADGGTPPPPVMLGAFGPLIGALVIRIRRARRGEPAPEHAVRFRRTHLLWAALLLAAASAIVLGAAFLAHAAGGPAPALDDAKNAFEEYGGPAAFLVGLLVSGPLSEEPGWRGTAYPRMRAAMNRYQVSAVLGVIWAVWHMPLFFITGTVQNELGAATPSGVLFAASSVPMAMLCCSAYERAGIAAAIAVHFATNATMVLLDVHAPVAQALIMGVQGVVAVGLLATVRPARRSPDAADAPVAPSATPA